MNYVWQDVRFRGKQAMKSYAKWGITYYFLFTAMIFPAVAQEILHHPPSTINGRIQGDISSALGDSELEFRSKQSLFHRPIALKLANMEENGIVRNFDESATENNLKVTHPWESYSNGAR